MKRVTSIWSDCQTLDAEATLIIGFKGALNAYASIISLIKYLSMRAVIIDSYHGSSHGAMHTL